MDCGLPGFSAHGILQVRILESVATPSPGNLYSLKKFSCIGEPSSSLSNICNKLLFIKIHDWRRTARFADLLPTTRRSFCQVSLVCKQVVWYLKEGGAESLPISQNTKESKSGLSWTSPLVQWLRVQLPMKANPSLAWEDSAYHGTAEPVSHKYWRLRALEWMLHSKWSYCNEKPSQGD